LRIFGLAGWSGSGKTTLMAKLLPELIQAGLRVSTIKHAHHAFDIDRPGKDSWQHRMAGASEVMVASANRWALMHELRGAPEPDLDELVTRMTPVDLLLVEGFKRHVHAKLEVFRRANAKPRTSSRSPLPIRSPRRGCRS
jgi:molybdopterin-guanine dinucleotide biosynthesis protein B